jgi:hypothetical protein
MVAALWFERRALSEHWFAGQCGLRRFLPAHITRPKMGIPRCFGTSSGGNISRLSEIIMTRPPVRLNRFTKGFVAEREHMDFSIGQRP